MIGSDMTNHSPPINTSREGHNCATKAQVFDGTRKPGEKRALIHTSAMHYSDLHESDKARTKERRRPPQLSVLPGTLRLAVALLAGGWSQRLNRLRQVYTGRRTEKESNSTSVSRSKSPFMKNYTYFSGVRQACIGAFSSYDNERPSSCFLLLVQSAE